MPSCVDWCRFFRAFDPARKGNCGCNGLARSFEFCQYRVRTLSSFVQGISLLSIRRHFADFSAFAFLKELAHVGNWWKDGSRASKGTAIFPTLQIQIFLCLAARRHWPTAQWQISSITALKSVAGAFPFEAYLHIQMLSALHHYPTRSRAIGFCFTDVATKFMFSLRWRQLSLVQCLIEVVYLKAHTYAILAAACTSWHVHTFPDCATLCYTMLY